MKLGQKAIEMDRDDLDARVAYGEALYEMYQRDKENKDIYNKCVKAWLIVHRNVLGNETSTAFKGISLPLANKFFEDENYGILAKHRLKSLCGRLPKFYESNSRYLRKVLIPIENVEGTIVSTREKTGDDKKSNDPIDDTSL